MSGKPRNEQWLETITHEDTVVCVLGEHESQSGEAASRAFLTLPEEQQVLFEKIAERTSNIVTVVIAGRPLDLRRISEKSKAVIMAWRPGTMGAEAIIDIVYGRINPSGKLSVSIPWCVGQVPISYWDVKPDIYLQKIIQKTVSPADIWISRIRRYIHSVMDCPIQSLIFRTLMCR